MSEFERNRRYRRNKAEREAKRRNTRIREYGLQKHREENPLDPYKPPELAPRKCRTCPVLFVPRIDESDQCEACFDRVWRDKLARDREESRRHHEFWGAVCRYCGKPAIGHVCPLCR